MTKHVVHYRLSDGEIVAQHIGISEQKTPAGCRALEIENSTGMLSYKTHCVSLQSKQVVERSAAQKSAIKATDTARFVSARVASELARTDYTQMPDYKIAPAQRATWALYRQALRDLSKNGLTGEQQLAAWPTSPDGRPAPVWPPDKSQ